MANVIKSLIIVTLNKLMDNVLFFDIVSEQLMFQIIKCMICILFCTVTLLLFREYDCNRTVPNNSYPSTKTRVLTLQTLAPPSPQGIWPPVYGKRESRSGFVLFCIIRHEFMWTFRSRYK